MDKEEFRVKLEEINNLVEQKDYEGAVNIVDSIDWRRVRNVRTLCVVGEIYAANRRYEDSRDIFLMAYNRAPIGKNILYRLIEISLKLGDIQTAEEYYHEFMQIASEDNTHYILQYKIQRAKKDPLEEQIRTLEEYREKELTERWSYELANLYYQAGNREKALSLCNEIILWFSDGTYVLKAMDIKQRMGELKGEEKEFYDRHFQPHLKKVAIPDPADQPMAESKALTGKQISHEPVRMPSLEIPESMRHLEQKKEIPLPGEERESVETSPAREQIRPENTADGETQRLAQESAPEEEVELVEETADEEENAAEDDVEAEVRQNPETEEEFGSEEDAEAEEEESEPEEDAEAEEKAVPEEEEERDSDETAGDDLSEDDMIQLSLAQAVSDIMGEREEESGEDSADTSSSEDKALTDTKASQSEPEIVEDIMDPSIHRLDPVRKDRAQLEEEEFLSEEILAEAEREFWNAPGAPEEVQEEKQTAASESESESESETETVTEEEDEEDYIQKKEAEAFDQMLKESMDEEDAEEESRESQEKKELTDEEKLARLIDTLEEKETSDPAVIVPRENVLSEDEVKLFTYFVRVPNMKEQLISTLIDVQNAAVDMTSRRGNIIVMGGRETGKTRLIGSLIPAICMELHLEAAKVAYVFAEDINGQDIQAIVGKLSGGFLVIEEANQLTSDTVELLNQAMEENTEGMRVILEDEKIGMRKFMNRFQKFSQKFTSMINIPIFTNDELVNFARFYALENGYRIDQMGMLALYNQIGENQKEDQPMNIGSVKVIIDKAIEKAEKGILKISRRKRIDRDGFITLHEKDFS